MGGLFKRIDHKAFKQPLPEYEKGKFSKIHKNNHHAKINYTYTNTNNFIHMIVPIEYLCMMGPNSEN